MNKQQRGPGWRYFRCEDCGMHWRETCRDAFTPSQSACPSKQFECVQYGGESPYKGELDENIPTDGYGNLHKDAYKTEILPR